MIGGNGVIGVASFTTFCSQVTGVEESTAAVRELFYETLNNLREEEKKIKAEAWMFERDRHTLRN